MSDLEGEVPLVTGSVEVRARVCAQARGLDAWSVGSRRRAVEDHLRFARGSGAAGGTESARLEAELPEWQRIEALLDSCEGARYDPESDPVAVAAADEVRRRERAAADAQEAARRAERERREGGAEAGGGSQRTSHRPSPRWRLPLPRRAGAWAAPWTTSRPGVAARRRCPWQVARGEGRPGVAGLVRASGASVRTAEGARQERVLVILPSTTECGGARTARGPGPAAPGVQEQKDWW